MADVRHPCHLRISYYQGFLKIMPSVSNEHFRAIYFIVLHCKDFFSTKRPIVNEFERLFSDVKI